MGYDAIHRAVCAVVHFGPGCPIPDGGVAGGNVLTLAWSNLYQHLVVGGTFSNVGNSALIVEGFAVWRASSWVHPGISLPATPSLNCYTETPYGNYYLGFASSGNATLSGAAVTVNEPKLTPSLVYTRALPTVTGWYWHKADGNTANKPNVLDTFAMFLKVVNTDNGGTRILALVDLKRYLWAEAPSGGWWAGPIVAPEFKP